MATDIRLKETELQAVTDQLVESYSACGRLHHLGHEPLPSREAVADILADMFEVIYPGYGRRQNLNVGNIAYYVGRKKIPFAAGYRAASVVAGNLSDMPTGMRMATVAAWLKSIVDSTNMPMARVHGYNWSKCEMLPTI